MSIHEQSGLPGAEEDWMIVDADVEAVPIVSAIYARSCVVIRSCDDGVQSSRIVVDAEAYAEIQAFEAQYGSKFPALLRMLKRLSGR